MFCKVRQIEFILNREVSINELKFDLMHLTLIELINTAQAMGKIKKIKKRAGGGGGGGGRQRFEELEW